MAHRPEEAADASVAPAGGAAIGGDGEAISSPIFQFHFLKDHESVSRVFPQHLLKEVSMSHLTSADYAPQAPPAVLTPVKSDGRDESLARLRAGAAAAA